MYLAAIKPVRRQRAYFLDPVLLQGREHAERWAEAIAAIPPGIRKRVAAFVSDGFRGSQALSERYGWIHQRCHFHLLSALVRGKGRRRYHVRGSRLRDKILETTRILLCSRNAATLQKARGNLRRFVDHPACPTYIRKHALECLEREQDFRAYLRYPTLHLPTTTNAIESAGKLIRKATSTARTPRAVLERATTFLHLRKSITCNGHPSTELCQ
jgi:transposase-like protein